MPKPRPHPPGTKLPPGPKGPIKLPKGSWPHPAPKPRPKGK
jgi:hypothetical protein